MDNNRFFDMYSQDSVIHTADVPLDYNPFPIFCSLQYEEPWTEEKWEYIMQSEYQKNYSAHYSSSEI